MPQQVLTAVENNFTKGLITEYTGLNFPENAATSASNCEFTIIGDVVRRYGINKEVNGITQAYNTTNLAISEYVWNNPGGDGNSKLFVQQIGGTLFFYNVATSTVATPLSTQILAGNITCSNNVVPGQVFDATVECQYADGNGYLFVYHPSCDPFYVTYNAATKALASNSIPIQIRDFVGVVDGLPISTRPTSLSADHQYNLQNQGWTSGNPWSATSTATVTLGSNSFTVASGLTGVTNGQIVTITISSVVGGGSGTASGTVTSYSGTTMVINVTSQSGVTGTSLVITPTNTGYLTTWKTAEGNYPSNADVWWYFKNTSNAFDPATTAGNVSLSSGNAPQGHYILNAFNQDRASQSGLSVTSVTTTSRPATGTWFQGRVWYTGVNAYQAATGDANFYTWTENIYFSQIATNVSEFGLCYQTNDPTSQNLHDLLPTDGGVITIVGSGTIHRLFPIANGMLVFANNGIWFITGSQGIGFSATDYTITKISSVKVLSSKSFVDVLGMPYFWNEEGIYQVVTGQSGSLAVEPITLGTILSYYNNIPLASKQYARGSYDPISYTIQWVYRSTKENSIVNRYQFDTILNYSTYNKAFFPYNVASNGSNYINGIAYISYPFINSATPSPGFKYSYASSSATSFAEEYDTTFVDWGSVNYVSTFTTGYKLPGNGLRRLLMPYIYVYSRNPGYLAYYIQGVWDYATTSSTSKISNKQFAEILDANTGFTFKRHRIRGRGMALQLEFTSVAGQPFDFIGWSLYDNVNTGV